MQVNGVQANFNPPVLKFANVPIDGVETRCARQLIVQEQVSGDGVVELDSARQPFVEQAKLNPHVDGVFLLPAQFGIFELGQDNRRVAVIRRNGLVGAATTGLEDGQRGKAADAFLITHRSVGGFQPQVVQHVARQTLHEGFVAEHPTGPH